jgi:hypothetical protein
MTSGTTNLLTEPLKVSAGQENAWIVVRIAVSSPPPWVKVRGKVTGWSNTAPSLPNAVPPMVSLNPTQASGFIGGSNPPRLPPPAPAPIAPDGVFEFPRVPRGTYNVGVFPAPAGGPPAVLFAANDVDDLRIAVPESREIAGQVEVEGNGPMPRLLFTLVDPKDDRTLGSAHAGVPMADGAFKITLPDAGFRLRLWCCLPPGYTLESMTYDGIDLKSNPLKLSGPDAMLRLRFATSSKNWFRVSGTVTGAGAKPASMKVSLIPEPHVTENDFPQTTVISTDGSFEFPAVVPGTYLAKLTPLPDGAIESRILVKVGDANVTEVQIHAPAYVRMPVRVSVEGNSPAPRVVFRSSADAELRPLSYPNLPGPVDLSLVLPEGEQSVTIVPEFLPRGYTVKAFTADGKTDLLRETLKVSANTPPELQIEFGVPPDSLFRITGRSLRFPEGGAAFAGDEPIVFLSGEPTLRFVGWRDCSMIPSGGVCIGLTARIAADGTFEFPAVPAGSYKLTVRDLRPAPVTVTVTNKDVIGIEIP